MDLHRPFQIVTPTVDGDVLQVLARADHAFTPPEVHRLVGDRSESGVRRALERLGQQGIVERRRFGQAHTYRLNREHLAYPHLVAIATLRDELLSRLRSELAAWAMPPRFAAIFGSAARGPMRPDSDIDLFLVRVASVPSEHAVWRDQVDGLAAKVRGWTGNDARPIEMATDEVLTRLASGDDALLGDIRHLGIPIFGSRSDLAEIMAGAS